MKVSRRYKVFRAIYTIAKMILRSSRDKKDEPTKEFLKGVKLYVGLLSACEDREQEKVNLSVLATARTDYEQYVRGLAGFKAGEKIHRSVYAKACELLQPSYYAIFALWGIFSPSEPSYAVQLGQALKWARYAGLNDGALLLVVTKLSPSLRYDIGGVVEVESSLAIITPGEAKEEKKSRERAQEDDDDKGSSNLSQPSQVLSDGYDGVEAPSSSKKGDKDTENEEEDRG